MRPTDMLLEAAKHEAVSEEEVLGAVRRERERERERSWHCRGSEGPIYAGEAGTFKWWGRAAGWLKAKSCPFFVWPMFAAPCPKW
jgi:hypothetical protein